MKIYFTASLSGVQYYKRQYKQLFDLLVTFGHTHLDTDLLTLNKTKYYAELESKGKELHMSVYKKKIKTIQSADICIFDVTFPSLAVGYQIERSLRYHKPTIVLYVEGNTPFFLGGIADERFIIRPYRDENVEQVLKETIAIASKKKEQRFNFFLSPELLSFVEEASEKRGMTKSVYIRSLIERDMIMLHEKNTP